MQNANANASNRQSEKAKDVSFVDMSDPNVRRYRTGRVSPEPMQQQQRGGYRYQPMQS